MSTGETVVGVIVGTIVGVTSAIVAQRAVQAVQELSHIDEIEDAKRRSFRDGWDAASKSVENVRKAYQKLIEPENVETRTAFRG